MNDDFKRDLEDTLEKPIELNVPLSKYTTFGIGGPAEYLTNAQSSEDMIQALEVAHKHGIPAKVVGGGSNLLFADEGIQGLVIRNQILDFEIIHHSEVETHIHQVTPRFVQVRDLAKYISADLEPSFNAQHDRVYVKVGTGWKMNPLVLKCIQEGITGPEWFGGIPGSLGGGIFMNMHGGEYYWSDFVCEVDALSTKDLQEKGDVVINRFTNTDLRFAYDFSALHESHDVVLTAILQLYRGDTAKAQNIFDFWAKKKIVHQSQRSAGCIWQNLSRQEQDKAGLPTPSIGYIIDQVFNMKGYAIGGAKISDLHAAFVENFNNATAKDVLEIVHLVENKVKEKYDIQLKREVEFINCQ